MPIVFVHGVNTRRGPAYDASVKVKENYLKRSLLGVQINGKTLHAINAVAFPYWGDLGAKFAWNMASLPRGEMQALGAPTEADLRAFLAHVRDALPAGLTAEPLLALARHDFGNAVELLASMALDFTPEDMVAETASLVVAIQQYAATNPQPPWLNQISTDPQLLTRLINVVARLKQAAIDMMGTAVDRVGDFASSKLLSWAREPLNQTLGLFFGDVFVYLDSRGRIGNPGQIPVRILDAVDLAVQGAPSDEPLVVVGHSLGGVILFDLLSHFRPDLKVDLFVSVGSQVAHFEELKLYRSSDPTIGAPLRATTPGNISHWINVYDEVDIFAYAAKGVFDRVDVDARYDTKTYVIKAHGAYFDQARFYERLRARIDKL